MAEWEYAPAPESAAIGRLRESYGMFVDGQFTGGEGGTLKTVNPANEEVLAEVAVAGEADVDRAVAAARRAYETIWGPMPGRDRAGRKRPPLPTQVGCRWHPSDPGRKRPSSRRCDSWRSRSCASQLSCIQHLRHQPKRANGVTSSMPAAPTTTAPPATSQACAMSLPCESKFAPK